MDTNLTLIAATAIGKMMVMVLVGMLAVKINVLDEKMTDGLKNVVMNILMPAVLLSSYFQEYSAEKARGLIMAIGYGIIMQASAIIIASLCIRKGSSPNWEVERMAIIYGNVAFMGIPLMSAMLGQESVFYLSGTIVAFNIFLWTHGVAMMTGKVDRKNFIKIFLSPNVVCIILGAILYFGRIPLSELITQPISNLGACVTPVSMIVSGAVIIRSDFKKILTNLRVYFVTALKLFVCPIVLMILFKFMNTPYMIAITTVVAAACPTATLVTMFALQYGKNAEHASGIFTLATTLSLVTIPAIVALYGMF